MSLKTKKNKRSQLRRHFTTAANEVDLLLGREERSAAEEDQLKRAFMQLTDKAERLEAADAEVLDAMSQEEEVDEERDREFDEQEAYRERWLNLRMTLQTTPAGNQQTVPGAQGKTSEEKRNFKLPKLELVKFDGNVKNWIAFWGQFKKIHDDPRLDSEDKFQYLVQATTPGSSARELVESFPPSAANYNKAIDQLKARFAKDEFLIEVYVRELLQLVLNQTLKRQTMALSSLFDKLETQLRALESLGVTRDRFAAMLYPLVESALPEAVLKAWERHRTQAAAADRTPSGTDKNYLQLLLDFVRAEVESEERLQLAKASFSCDGDRDSKEAKPSRARQAGTSTTATIVATSENKAGPTSSTRVSPECIFCSKHSHASQDCASEGRTQKEMREIIIQKRACFRCLRPGHNAQKCKTFVKCILCAKKHYLIVCPELDKTKSKIEADKALLSHQQGPSEILLQTLQIRVENPRNRRRHCVVRALCDSGSQRSYITAECAQSLGLVQEEGERISHRLFGGIETKEVKHGVFTVSLGKVGSSFRTEIELLDQENICSYVPRLQNPNYYAALRQKGIRLSDIAKGSLDVKVLLGADILPSLLTGRIEKIDEGLLATETLLGWTVMGKSYGVNESKGQSNLLCLLNNRNPVISDLWSLDVLGIRDPVEVRTREKLEAEAFVHFERTVSRHPDGRYEVHLPWLKGHPELVDNRNVAERRLHSVTKRLKNIGKIRDYGTVFQEWLEDGVIEKAPESTNSGPCYYLPHHAVIKDSSATTKIRPVFDASNKDANGNSLNSCLEKGPNMLEKIPHLLINFRRYGIGVTSDIKRAFLQISLSLKDRDYLRFLWWGDKKQQRLVTYRHCRVVFGVSSSPFLLAATITHHLKRAPERLKATAEKLIDSFYVDNCVISLENEKQLEKFVTESRELMCDAQFDLRGWVRNLPKLDLTSGFFETKDRVVPVLGLLWDIVEDELFCDVSSVSLASNVVTKRNLLSVAQRVFDPIGFTAPVSLIPKLLLREVGILKFRWDDELPPTVVNKFKKWVDQIPWLNKCRIPRTFFDKVNEQNSTSFSLHTFCDASTVAYAACTFLRAVDQSGVHLKLVGCKSRITPVKPMTIPRKELVSALIGARLWAGIVRSINLPDCKYYFWSDSMVALTWIRNREEWSTFVGNRCKEIAKLTDINDWRFIPGHLNPADLPSRGTFPKTLVESRWWEGPAWLRGAEEDWPNATPTEIQEEAVYVEQKKSAIVSAVSVGRTDFVSSLLYFSKFSRMVRMCAWMYRFYNRIRGSGNQGELNGDELAVAERKLMLCVQRVSNLSGNPVEGLQVYTDKEGLVRVQTKLTMGADGESFKYPILLPARHEVVTRLIQEQHIINGHAGVQTLLVILRESYWIVRARRTVRNVVSRCVVCKRYRAKAAEPPFAPLPLERISDGNAFETTGIDCTGPLNLKNGGKVWVILFTCAMYRAVHLEPLPDLSTHAFLEALRRFIARRGRVQTIYTDNGTNFRGASNLLDTIDWDQVQVATSTTKMRWRFIPPSAAWWGGWWERLIKMVKELLRRNIGRATLTYVELTTTLCDIEALINTRPLTYFSEDDVLSPLTPAMFVQSLPTGEVPDLDAVYASSLQQRQRYLQKIREDLRHRFRKEYLALLVQRGDRRVKSIQPGEVVLIEDINQKRLFWQLGLVKEVLDGRDGNPRVAVLRTAKNEDVVRPFQRLYPLEVSKREGNT